MTNPATKEELLEQRDRLLAHINRLYGQLDRVEGRVAELELINKLNYNRITLLEARLKKGTGK